MAQDSLGCQAPGTGAPSRTKLKSRSHRAERDTCHGFSPAPCWLGVSSHISSRMMDDCVPLDAPLVSLPQALAAKPLGRVGMDALRALTQGWVHFMTNQWFFQHCVVFPQCLHVSVALISQYFCYFPLSQPPCFFICVTIFHLASIIIQSTELFYPLNFSIHPGACSHLALQLPVMLSVYCSTGFF